MDGLRFSFHFSSSFVQFSMIYLVLLLFGTVKCSKSMLEMWGAPSGTYYPKNASQYEWQDCMIACYKMDECVLAAEVSTDVGCNLFTYYNVTTVVKTDPYTTKVAFKMNVPDDTCPSSKDPPLFGSEIAYCNVINPISTAPSNYHQWAYTIIQPSTGTWTLTYYPCYNTETPITINNTIYCIFALSVQTNYSVATSSCDYRNGSVVAPLDDDQFVAMTAVAASTGNTYWTSGTLDSSCAANYSEGYNTAEPNGKCGVSQLFQSSSGSNILGTFQPNYPCSGGTCNSCLAISSAGLQDVKCTGSYYVMCLAQAYTVSNKAVVL